MSNTVAAFVNLKKEPAYYLSSRARHYRRSHTQKIQMKFYLWISKYNAISPSNNATKTREQRLLHQTNNAAIFPILLSKISISKIHVNALEF